MHLLFLVFWKSKGMQTFSHTYSYVSRTPSLCKGLKILLSNGALRSYEALPASDYFLPRAPLAFALARARISRRSM